MYVNIANISNLIIFIKKMRGTTTCIIKRNKLIDKILLYVYKYC